MIAPVSVSVEGERVSEASAPRPGARSVAIVFLIAATASWNVGNVGGVVADLSRDFDISLASIGLLSGSLLLGFSALGTVTAPEIISRIGILRSMMVAVALGIVGNLVFAVSDSYAVFAIGRAVTGVGLGITVVAGPVYARGRGGVGLVALFGAAIQFGIAGGLGIGAVLSDAGVDWRIIFVLSAALAVVLFPLLVGAESIEYKTKAGGGFVRLAIRSSRVWRIAALFIAVFAVPLVLGSWLVRYLSVDNSLAVGTAGILSFLMFGISGAARELGGKLAERGVSVGLLLGATPWLATAGLLILALDDSLGFAVIAVLLAGIGFAIPYGPAIIQAQKLYPADPAEPVALVSLVGTAVPVPLVPIIGSLLNDGYGTEVFIALAAIVAVAALLNMTPVGAPLEEPARD
jgi:predicted MFS family arabinose efflux permease